MQLKVTCKNDHSKYSSRIFCFLLVIRSSSQSLNTLIIALGTFHFHKLGQFSYLLRQHSLYATTKNITVVIINIIGTVGVVDVVVVYVRVLTIKVHFIVQVSCLNLAAQFAELIQRNVSPCAGDC